MTFPASAKTECWCFLVSYISEIFEAVHDDNMYQALDIHTGFCDLDPRSRSQETLKKRKEDVLTVFSFSTWGVGALAFPVDFLSEFVLK